MLWACPESNISLPTAEEWRENLRKFIPYIIIGGLTAMGNILIILAILRHKEQRKKYYLTAALAGGDLFNGLGFFFAGLMRLITVLWGTHKALVSSFECMTRLYNVFFIAPGGQLPIMITFAISFERFLAITWPVKFYHWPVAKVAKITIGVLYGYCLFSLGMGFVAAASQHGTCVENICFAPKAMGPHYGLYHFLVGIIFGLAAVLVYIATIVVSWANTKKFKNASGSSNSVALEKLERQKRITRTMGIIILLTFVTVVLPSFCLMLGFVGLPIEFDWYDSLTPYFGPSICSNSGINVLVYIATNSELRGMLKRTLLCRSPNSVSTVTAIGGHNAVRLAKEGNVKNDS